ncbi:MAG: polymer-forming cytoskeletal protein [Pyrinomonadaceae bacterium]|nr:polymer-forming cytoskeletal protein [Pyrinomonadaceae bacterium]
MIRMGKSSKTDETNETTELQQQTSTTEFSGASRTTGTAVSESELMARDIKEGRLSGFVGGGTVLTGETTFEAMLRVDGHLKGSVTSEDGTLIVGANGRVDADIIVSEAIVNGSVEGDITAGDKLTLGRTATVVGNVQAPRLIIEDGAVLEGSCSMIESKDSLQSRTEEKRFELATNELPTINEREDEEEEIEALSYEDEVEAKDDEFDEDEEDENADAATV